jgi:hypothetical protein
MIQELSFAEVSSFSHVSPLWWQSSERIEIYGICSCRRGYIDNVKVQGGTLQKVRQFFDLQNRVANNNTLNPTSKNVPEHGTNSSGMLAANSAADEGAIGVAPNIRLVGIQWFDGGSTEKENNYNWLAGFTPSYSASYVDTPISFYPTNIVGGPTPDIVSNSTFVIEELANGYSTLGNIYGAAFGIGWEIGRAIAQTDPYLEVKYWLQHDVFGYDVRRSQMCSACPNSGPSHWMWE